MEAIVSTFLPLGPLGQGGFAIMQLGKVACTLCKDMHTLPAVANAGDTLYTIGFLIAIIMCAFGLVWVFFAVATISRTNRFPFNMGEGFGFVSASCCGEISTTKPKRVQQWNTLPEDDIDRRLTALGLYWDKAAGAIICIPCKYALQTK
ncbi:Plasma membrane sulfite pump involved in sulfite metabolism, partial [Elasticomyces elasticus]